MNWGNWGEFFTMGGYGVYVWGSYGIAALVLVLNIILPLRARRAVTRQVRARARTRTPRAAALNRKRK